MTQPQPTLSIERFINGVHAALAADLAYLQQALVHPEPGSPVNEFVASLTSMQVGQFLEQLKTFQTDTVATVFGILDSTTGSDLLGYDFEVRSVPDGPNLAGDLQGYFLAADDGGPFDV